MQYSIYNLLKVVKTPEKSSESLKWNDYVNHLKWVNEE